MKETYEHVIQISIQVSFISFIQAKRQKYELGRNIYMKRLCTNSKEVYQEYIRKNREVKQLINKENSEKMDEI